MPLSTAADPRSERSSTDSGEGQFRTDSVPWTAWAAVRGEWQALCAKSPYRSFVLAAEWVDAWLSVFGPALAPAIIIVRSAVGPVGACLLVTRRVRVAGITLRRVYLNTSGEDEADEPYMEFNDLLCLPGYEGPVAAAVRTRVSASGWDEVQLDGCRRSAAIEALVEAFAQDTTMTRRTVQARHVDLVGLRADAGTYESYLSQKTRYNIRQSLKLYQARGAVVLHEAESVGEALAMLDELSALSARRWQGEATPGAFHSPLFTAFHRQLVAALHDRRGVQLIRVTAADQIIGILYNFVDSGTSYFYQCGFAYDDNKRLRPGLVTLFTAVDHAFRAGLSEFNMMAGDAEYKRALAKDARELDWITLRRDSLKQHVITGLRRVKAATVRHRPASVATQFPD